MRKILSILFCFISVTAYSQFPSNPTVSNTSTNTISQGAGTFNRGIGTLTAIDTTALNNITYTKGVPNIIASTGGGVLWQRNSTATQWIQIGGGSGTPSCGSLVGGYVSWDTLLIFQISAASQYCINGTSYSSAGGQITLNTADPSLPRIDVIALNTSGQVVKITGVPSATPSTPQVDPATQYYLTSVLVNAGSVAPTGIYSSVLYDEQSAGEWVGSATGLTANFGYSASPTNVYHLTKSTDVGAFTNGDVIDYTGVTYPITQYNLLRFFVKLKSTIDPTANISVTLLSNGLPFTVPLTLTSANGFSKSNTTSFQNITIPFSDFQFTSDPPVIDGIRFTMNGSNVNGYYLDYITIQGGVQNNTGNGNFLTDVFQNAALDTLYKVKNGVTTAFAVIPSSDTVVTKLPLHAIAGTGTDHDSIAVYGVDSSFQNFTVRGDSLIAYRFNGDSSSYALSGLGYIPITGTEVDKPVTGDIGYGTLDGDFRKIIFQDADGNDNYINIGNENVYVSPLAIGFNSINNDNGRNYVGVGAQSSYLGYVNNDGTVNKNISVGQNVPATITDTDPTSAGLTGSQDFTANITDLDYTQKKYIDNNFWKLGGNDITDPATQWFGSISDQPLYIKINNTLSGIISKDNTVLGYGAFSASDPAASRNIALGKDALNTLTTGTSNIGLGQAAGGGLTDGNNNLFIGATSTTNPSVQRSIALGDQAEVSADFQLALTNSITHIKAVGLGTPAVGNVLTDANGDGVFTAQPPPVPKYTQISADYEILPSDNTVSVNNGGTNVIITLPNPAITPIGKRYTLKHFDDTSVGTITIVAATGALVQDFSTLTFLSSVDLAVVGNYGQTQVFVNNGTQWEGLQ